MMSWHYYIWSK